MVRKVISLIIVFILLFTLSLCEQKIVMWGTMYFYKLTPVKVSTDGVLHGKVVTKIYAGVNHNLVIANDQTFSWGFNLNGQLGDGHTYFSTTPTTVIMPTNVTFIDINAAHFYSVAIGSDYKVYSWGKNNLGQLGSGAYVDQDKPFPVCFECASEFVPRDIKIIKVAAHELHVLALTENGTIVAWGDNSYGQLGDDTIVGKNYPILTKNISTQIIDIDAGLGFSLAVTKDGKVYSWGKNDQGQLGLNDLERKKVPTLITALAERNVYITKVSAGFSHTLALSSAGDLYTWGHNLYGALGLGIQSTDIQNVPEIIKPIWSNTIVEFAAGEYYSTVLTNNGSLYSWGNNVYGQVGDETRIERNEPVVSTVINYLPGKIVNVSTEGLHVLVLLDTGDMYAWGCTREGQLGNGSMLANTNPSFINTSMLVGMNISYLTVGDDHNFLLTSTGRLFAFGNNQAGQLGINNTRDQDLPVEVIFPNNVSVAFVAAGSTFSVILTKEGEPYWWGTFRFINGTKYVSLIPTKLNLETPTDRFSMIAANGMHAIFLTKDGKVYGIGENSKGELGDGKLRSTLIPSAMDTSNISGNKTVTQVACGNLHTVILTVEGRIYSFGDNTFGQFGDGTTTSNIIPSRARKPCSGSLNSFKFITCGGFHTVTKTDTGVYGWGRNGSGQLGIEPDPEFGIIESYPMFAKSTINMSIADIELIATGEFFTIVVYGGKAFAYGSNQHGQLGSMLNLKNYSYNPIQVNMTDLINTTHYAVTQVEAGYAHAIALVECRPGYFGQNCSLYSCSHCNLTRSICTGPTTCLCKTPYDGTNCDNWKCGILFNNDTKVCSGNGNCTEQGICSCSPGYELPTCKLFSCGGILSNESNTCNRNGLCTSPDYCECHIVIKYFSDKYCKPDIPLMVGLGLVVIFVLVILLLTPCIFIQIRIRYKKYREKQRDLELLTQPLIPDVSNQLSDRDYTERIIRFEELKFHERISEGGFGIVFSGTYQGTDVAIKMIRRDRGDEDDFRHEVQVLNHLRHPNIVLFMGICITEDRKYIVTELMLGNSLDKVIHPDDRPRFNEKRLHLMMSFTKKVRLLKQVVKGMMYLHGLETPLLHRDLKPSNILLDKNRSIAKLCDFGTAKPKRTQMTGNIGTLFYTAPEILENQKYYNEYCDIYSFGIIMYEVFFEILPYSSVKRTYFGEVDEDDITDAINIYPLGAQVIRGKRPEIPDVPLTEAEKMYIELMKKAWDESPLARPSFEGIFKQMESWPIK
jgi:alpha-tubulin suppressor-like RCC1 family protein